MVAKNDTLQPTHQSSVEHPAQPTTHSNTATIEKHKALASEQTRSKKELLWKDVVSLQLYNSVDETERKRQEIIFEIIQTENNFANDLENLHKFFVKPLAETPVLSNTERSEFLHIVFTNILDIKSNSQFFSNALNELQARTPLIQTIGDVFLSFMDGFDLFKEYGANQVYGKKRLEEELNVNPLFKNFIMKQERLPELRKLTLQSFLASPTTRLGRYPLLLEAVLKYTTTTNNPTDKECIPKAIQSIKSILNDINHKTGLADNRVRLIEISKKLYGKEEDIKDLDLYNKNRTLVTEATIKKKTTVDNIEYVLFLFDHYLLLTKKRKNTSSNSAGRIIAADSFDLKVVKKPIPLELLYVTNKDPSAHTPETSVFSLPAYETHANTNNAINRTASSQHQLVLTHIGKAGFSHILNFKTHKELDKVKTEVAKQQEKKEAERMLFNRYLVISSDELLSKLNVNCCALSNPNENSALVLVGTDSGICAKLENEQTFTLLLPMEKVVQLEILAECNLVLVLSDKTLFSIPYHSVINKNNKPSVKQSVRKLSSHVSFFKIGGTSKNNILISVVKATSLSSTIKVYEPTVTNPLATQQQHEKASHPFSKLFSTSTKTKMRIFREFYIPSEVFSLYYLKSKLCIGCAKGFEIVDIDTLETMGLLDPTDPDLDFITKKEVSRPLAFFKVKDRRFFLCYSDFGLFVDKVGRLITHPHKLILNWKGIPSQFHVIDKYILAFSPYFVEIWNLESGALMQVIRTICATQILKLLKGFEDHAIIYDNAAHLDLNNHPAAINVVKPGLFSIKINRNHPPNTAQTETPNPTQGPSALNKRNGLVIENNTNLQ